MGTSTLVRLGIPEKDAKMSLLDLGELVLKAIVPPISADPRVHYFYRLRLTLVACAAFCLVCFGYVAALGMVPSVFPGFATNTTVNLILEDSMEDSIRAKLRLRCNTKDADFRKDLSNEVNGIERQYFALTKQGYRQPTCEELE